MIILLDNTGRPHTEPLTKDFKRDCDDFRLPIPLLHLFITILLSSFHSDSRHGLETAGKHWIE